MTRCEFGKRQFCTTMRLALQQGGPVQARYDGPLGQPVLQAAWEQRLSLGPDFPPPSYCPWCGAKILIQPRVTGQPNEV